MPSIKNAATSHTALLHGLGAMRFLIGVPHISSRSMRDENECANFSILVLMGKFFIGETDE